jgi:hypothetical protein
MSEQTQIDSSSTLQQSLRIYRIEPLGLVLSGWLHLPLYVIWFLFVILYFGILLILHHVVGTQPPTNLGDIFRLPPIYFYYPNLIAIMYDLVGHPLLLVLLIFFRDHISSQFAELERSGFIREKSTTSRIARAFRFLGTNSRVQTLLIIIVPLLVAVVGLGVDVVVWSPKDTPGSYAVLVSSLGRYGRLAAFAQLVYIFVVLGNYEYSFSLHLNHPDGCSGLAPFGKLAIAGYTYLFVFAMMQAVGSAAGSSGFEKALNAIGLGSFAYLWILFPLALILIFDRLIYRPHRVLKELQLQYLRVASAAWTNYHQQLTSSIVGAVEQSKTPLTNKASFHFGDDLELLNVWERLNKYVEEMHTWPIPKRVFPTIAILANPLIPMLLPVVVDVVKSRLP